MGCFYYKQRTSSNHAHYLDYVLCLRTVRKYCGLWVSKRYISHINNFVLFSKKKVLSYFVTNKKRFRLEKYIKTQMRSFKLCVQGREIMFSDFNDILRVEPYWCLHDESSEIIFCCRTCKFFQDLSNDYNYSSVG